MPGYPVPVFQIPFPAEPVQDIWQQKKTENWLSSEMISESNVHFLNKNAQKKNLPAHFPDSCNRYACITGSPKTKAGYPVFAQILGFFPVQPLIYS